MFPGDKKAEKSSRSNASKKQTTRPSVGGKYPAIAPPSTSSDRGLMGVDSVAVAVDGKGDSPDTSSSESGEDTVGISTSTTSTTKQPAQPPVAGKYLPRHSMNPSILTTAGGSLDTDAVENQDATKKNEEKKEEKEEEKEAEAEEKQEVAPADTTHHSQPVMFSETDEPVADNIDADADTDANADADADAADADAAKANPCTTPTTTATKDKKQSSAATDTIGGGTGEVKAEMGDGINAPEETVTPTDDLLGAEAEPEDGKSNSKSKSKVGVHDTSANTADAVSDEETEETLDLDLASDDGQDDKKKESVVATIPTQSGTGSATITNPPAQPPVAWKYPLTVMPPSIDSGEKPLDQDNEKKESTSSISSDAGKDVTTAVTKQPAQPPVAGKVFTTTQKQPSLSDDDVSELKEMVLEWKKKKEEKKKGWTAFDYIDVLVYVAFSIWICVIFDKTIIDFA